MKRILFVLLIFSLSACSIQPTVYAITSTTAAPFPMPITPAPVIVPDHTSLPIPTPIPLPAYPPVPTPDASAYAQPTTAPEATQPPFAIPQLPEITGSIDGPWLIYQIGSRPGPAPVTLAVMDLAGKNRYGIELPALSAIPNSHWDVILPTRGNFVAAQWFTYDIGKGGSSYEIWLLSIKEGRIIRKIQQFSDAALQEVQKIPSLLMHQRHSTETPIVSAINREPQWSPDGQYLAFSAAFEGTQVNLYLYDTQTDRIRQISYQVHQARFRAWSPDGRYIIYDQEVADDSYPDLGSWLVDLQNGKTRYLSRLRVKDSFQWESSESILTSECADEAPCFNLRRLDITSDQEKMLYSNIYNYAVVDPLFGVIFLVKGFLSGWPADEHGIYRLFEDGSVKKLVSEDFYTVQWNAALSLFIGTQSNLDVVAFDRYGAEKLRFPAAAETYVSPDGKWIGAAGNLYRADGGFIAHIGEVGPRFLWAPDSASFFYYSESGNLFNYSKSNGWQGELVGSQVHVAPLGIVQPPEQ